MHAADAGLQCQQSKQTSIDRAIDVKRTSQILRLMRTDEDIAA